MAQKLFYTYKHGSNGKENNSFVPSTYIFSYWDSLIFDVNHRTIWHQGMPFGNAYPGTYSYGEIFNDFDRNIALGAYSHAEGSNTFANGYCSHVEGANTYASEYAGHAEGNSSYSIGAYSHAEGVGSYSFGTGSHSEGNNTYTYGAYSHVEGVGNYSFGIGSHSEGNATYANGEYSHSEGISTTSDGEYSHSEGNQSKANGKSSHAEGKSTTADGESSHAEGTSTIASADSSHAEGTSNIIDNASLSGHAEGDNNNLTNSPYSHIEGGSSQILSGNYSHSEGYQNNLFGGSKYSHIEGIYNSTYSTSEVAHIEGEGNIANSSKRVHIEGSYNNSTSSSYSHIEGTYNTSNNSNVSHVGGSHTYVSDSEYIYTEGHLHTAYNSSYSHVEGKGNNLKGSPYSHVEGAYNTSTNQYVHIEGSNSSAYAEHTHVEGYRVMSYGIYSHVEGNSSVSYGNTSHVEGYHTYGGGDYSHVEGNSSVSYASASHVGGTLSVSYSGASDSFVHGNHVEAKNPYQVSFGKYNKSYTATNRPNQHSIFTLGVGTGEMVNGNPSRANAFEVQSDGTGYFYKDLYVWDEVPESRKESYFICQSHLQPIATKAYVGRNAVGRANFIVGGDGKSMQYVGAEYFNNYGQNGTRMNMVYADFGHAEGDGTYVNNGSTAGHAEGISTVTYNPGEHASGKYNKSVKGTTLFTIGCGSGEDELNRKNIFQVNNYDAGTNGLAFVDGNSIVTSINNGSSTYIWRGTNVEYKNASKNNDTLYFVYDDGGASRDDLITRADLVDLENALKEELQMMIDSANMLKNANEKKDSSGNPYYYGTYASSESQYVWTGTKAQYDSMSEQMKSQLDTIFIITNK